MSALSWNRLVSRLVGGCLGHGSPAIAFGFSMCGYRCDRSVSGHQAVRDREVSSHQAVRDRGVSGHQAVRDTGQPSPGLTQA